MVKDKILEYKIYFKSVEGFQKDYALDYAKKVGFREYNLYKEGDYSLAKKLVLNMEEMKITDFISTPLSCIQVSFEEFMQVLKTYEK